MTTTGSWSWDSPEELGDAIEEGLAAVTGGDVDGAAVSNALVARIRTESAETLKCLEAA